MSTAVDLGVEVTIAQKIWDNPVISSTILRHADDATLGTVTCLNETFFRQSVSYLYSTIDYELLEDVLSLTEDADRYYAYSHAVRHLDDCEEHPSGMAKYKLHCPNLRSAVSGRFNCKWHRAPNGSQMHASIIVDTEVEADHIDDPEWRANGIATTPQDGSIVKYAQSIFPRSWDTIVAPQRIDVSYASLGDDELSAWIASLDAPVGPLGSQLALPRCDIETMTIIVDRILHFTDTSNSRLEYIEYSAYYEDKTPSTLDSPTTRCGSCWKGWRQSVPASGWSVRSTIRSFWPTKTSSAASPDSLSSINGTISKLDSG